MHWYNPYKVHRYRPKKVHKYKIMHWYKGKVHKYMPKVHWYMRKVHRYKLKVRTVPVPKMTYCTYLSNLLLTHNIIRQVVQRDKYISILKTKKTKT